MEPGHEVYIVAYTAGDLLRGMNMGIDKTGQHILTLQVDDLCIRLYQLGVDLTDGNDLVAFHQHTTAVIDGLISTHGHNVTVL